MPIFDPGAILGVQGEQAYTIAKSLRFRSSASAYLSRTPGSAGNRKTWTWSGWVKRGLISGSATYEIFCGDNGATSFTAIRIVNNVIYLQDFVTATKNIWWETTAVFRDPSAWYHIVVKYDTSQASSTNSVLIYVNGVSQVLAFTAATGTYVQNYDGIVNSTFPQKIGEKSSLNYFDGYLSEVNFIDGQALTPSDFGQTDTATGVWSPKAYSGTGYGTNGFYLKFTDVGDTTTTNVGYGKDSSPNANRWQTNNFGTNSALTTYDSMVDTPTNATGDIGNYCVLNPLSLSGATLANANLKENAAAACSVFGTMALDGKFYFEDVLTFTQAGWSYLGVALTTTAPTAPTTLGGMPSNYWIWRDDGYKANAGASSAYGTAISTGQIGMVAYDQATGKLWFGAQGTWFGSGDPAAGTNPAYTLAAGTSVFPLVGSQGSTGATIHDANFGQRPFTYTPPSGFKALCTQNLPTPTIGATSSTLANKYFDATLYPGTGSAQSITNAGAFQPDLVWIKIRSTVSSHCFYDAVRGARTGLFPNLTNAEVTEAAGVSLTAFNSDGFSLGTDNAVTGSTNLSGGTYVGWQWLAGTAPTTDNVAGAGNVPTAGSVKINGENSSATLAGSIAATRLSANTSAGFSVVTYTGNGTVGATIAHGLGVKPSLIIAKTRNNVDNWPVYHTSLGATKYIYLNTTQSVFTNNTTWYDTEPTSSVFTVYNDTRINASSYTYVAYCFAEVAGYSKFGSYTGNGSADGTFVYCGFRPRYIMIKNASDGTTSWSIWDTARSTYNVPTERLEANGSSAESSLSQFDILSNGFKLRSTNSNNASGQTIIYAAFAESPFNYARAR